MFVHTSVPQILTQARCKLAVEVEVVLLKDSLHMDDADRSRILERCIKASESQLVITHGTDTMVETGQHLQRNINNKTIVLCGAMIPFAFGESDAPFNWGGAMVAVQTLPVGVYISMNGRILDPMRVIKNRETGVFEPIVSGICTKEFHQRRCER